MATMGVTLVAIPGIRIKAIMLDGDRIGSVAFRYSRQQWIAYSRDISLGRHFRSQDEAVAAFVAAFAAAHPPAASDAEEA